MPEKKKDQFTEYAESLQEQIIENEKKVFSEKVLEEFNNPHNLERMDDADGKAVVTGPCGDTLEIYLKVKNGRIENATYMTDGCGPTIACGSMVTKLISGKKLLEAERFTEDELKDALDGLPEDHEHCALLAVNTLGEAISDYKNRKRE